jgi:hypothetical protein
MNERIKEFIAQAGGIEHDDDGNELTPVLVGKELAKFADLIIQECRYVMDCNKGSDQNPAWNQALSETSLKIKQHFGVEE